MTRLYYEKLHVKCVELGRESTLPMLYEVEDWDEPMRSDLPEQDGLYICSLPGRKAVEPVRQRKEQGTVVCKSCDAPGVPGNQKCLVFRRCGMELWNSGTFPLYLRAIVYRDAHRPRRRADPADV